MANNRTQIFEDETTLISCLPELYNLRVAEKLTDLVIKLQGNVELHAHRVVFASRIPSLCDAICETSTLHWPKVSSEVAGLLVDYVYTGQLKVNETNAVGLIVLSQQLQMPQVEEWVVSFMAARLDSQTLANNWNLAEVLNSDQLRNVCLQHIKKNFEATVPSDFFIQLPADVVLSLLRADDLHVTNEESVFRAIQRWVCPLGEVDETRLVHAEAMMKEVRWNQIDADFRRQLQYDDEGFWNKNLNCLRLLGRIISWIDSPSSRGERQCPFADTYRGPLDDICVITGSDLYIPQSLIRYNFETNTSQHIIDVTQERDVYFVAIEHYIYAIGGGKTDGSYTNLDKFDTRDKRWTECASLRTGRTFHTAVTIKVGQEVVICVFGGMTLDYKDTDACALYSPKKDKWYELPNLNQATRYATAVALPNGRVFVIGGSSGRKELSSVEMCHLRQPADWQAQKKDSDRFWKSVSPMAHPGIMDAAVEFRGSIFVSKLSKAETIFAVFAPPDNQRPLGQWTYLSNGRFKGSFPAIVVWHDRLFCFGVKTDSSATRLEFVPRAGSSTPSRWKFDSWAWEERPWCGLDNVRRAFLMREL